MLTPKPFVQLACVCEKALVEPDNVASLIRVVDTYTVDPPAVELPPNVGVALPLTVVVSLKSGDVVGEHGVGLRLVNPNGDASTVGQWALIFNGGEHGVNIQIAFSLHSPTYGLYWFDVLWGDELLSRIPLRVKPRTSEPAAGPVESTETVMIP